MLEEKCAYCGDMTDMPFECNYCKDPFAQNTDCQKTIGVWSLLNSEQKDLVKKEKLFVMVERGKRTGSEECWADLGNN